MPSVQGFSTLRARSYVFRLPLFTRAIVLVIIFSVMEGDTFLTTNNFANLINQGAAIVVLAMGLTFVLLLGEIDLSAGFAAGMGAAILGVTLTQHGWPWPLTVLATLATGVATPDELARATALPAGVVAAALVELELAGAVTLEEGVVRSTIAR